MTKQLWNSVWWAIVVCLGTGGVMELSDARADSPNNSAEGASAASRIEQIESLLKRPLIDPNLPMKEVQEFTESRVPRMPKVQSVEEWEQHAERMREETLDRVVFRGAAAQWRTAPAQVEWLETIDGGPGYRIRKLRYEALPGLWIPALLYEPTQLEGRVPVVVNVNGHDRGGKAAPYKQIRCINLAKRGMLALNLEWVGMGQLATPNFMHYRMNQLDLCGTSGLAPFYLSMTRAIDLMLDHEHADPERVAVAGLSGGGWQTIFISALDPRVTLSNPVAGYSSFRTRARFLSDLGDSEQTPVDLATVADYSHLTAMRAPRPTLLTKNAQDQCCFKAEHALPPLIEAAQPIFDLYGKSSNLRTHVNHDPGSHNFEQDNREQLYAMIGDHFYPDHADYRSEEIPSENEVKPAEELNVELPTDNADFHTLALELSRSLPIEADLPKSKEDLAAWQNAARERLRGVLRLPSEPDQLLAIAESFDDSEAGQLTRWWLRIGGNWTVPADEFVRGTPEKTAILINDAGRQQDAGMIDLLLETGHRVLAVDPFYFGESRIAQRDFLFALLVSAVGERPLGLQTGQLASIARWADHEFHPDGGSVVLVARGPRTSLIALAAAALEPDAIQAVELHRSMGSLKEVIEQNKAVNGEPELFCFGLLEQFDILQLAAVVAPRPVRLIEPSERVQQELKPLRALYGGLGIEFDPLGPSAD